MASIEMKDIVYSLVGLTTTNGGLFKSEKQAKFLKSFFVGDTLTATISHKFGEFGGCTRLVEYVIRADDTSITFISKQGKVIWTAEQKQQSLNSYSKKQQERKEANEQQLADFQKELSRLQESLQKDTEEFIAAIEGKDQKVVEMAQRGFNYITKQTKKDIEDLEQHIFRVKGYLK